MSAPRSALTPYHGESVPSLTVGAEPLWFDLKGFRFATAICFEDSVARVVRGATLALRERNG